MECYEKYSSELPSVLNLERNKNYRTDYVTSDDESQNPKIRKIPNFNPFDLSNPKPKNINLDKFLNVQRFISDDRSTVSNILYLTMI